MARNVTDTAEELLWHRRERLVQKGCTVKLRLLWTVLFILVFWNPWHNKHEWFVAWGLAFLGVWTAWDRFEVIGRLRGAFREWQKTNNERHRLSGLAFQQLNRANGLDLELIELRRGDGLRRLIIETFLDPATVDAALRVKAERFSDACWAQRDFLLAVKTQGVSSANIEIELNAVQTQFHDLQRKNDQLKMGVETAKTKFWKAHDLVNTAIEEGILPPAYTLRNGASFSKYLPPKDQPAQ